MRKEKKKTSAWRRFLSVMLVCALAASLCPAAFAAERAGKIGTPDDKVLIAQTDYPLTKGVTESQVILNNTNGSAQVMGYLTTVAPGAAATFKASYSGYYTEGSTKESRAESAGNLKWDLRTTTGQAADFEAATGETVISATNADYYNMQTGQCSGYLIMEGNVVQTRGGSQEPYFAVLKDGSFVIRDYGADHSDVVEAISGPIYLLKNGEIQVGQDNSLAPRNSVGLKADGTVVTFLADGRQGVSNGMSMRDVAEMLKAQGCVTALYLDGGGSATLASRHEGSEKLEIQNTPSDGPERVVASSLLLVSTADRTNEFDHAALEPNNELYASGASVQFTASGVDAGGYPTGMPKNLKWVLTDGSFGEIDQTGLFHSNGKRGTVTVNLMQGTKAVGSTSIEVQEPDELFFAAESLNLAFNETTDLGLAAKCQSRTMMLDGMKLSWKVTSKTPGVADSAIGSFSDNKFTTVKAKQTLNATVAVSYTPAGGTELSDSIEIEVGRMPQVIFDFESAADGNAGAGVAQYDWGKAAEHAEGWTPPQTPITYKGWSDADGGQVMKTESGPFFFDGTYLDGPGDVCYYPASDIFAAAGYDYFAMHDSWMKTNSARGELVTADDGEVRFGERAMRIDYDFTDLKDGYRNLNLTVCRAGEDVALPGTPSGLGMWVYAPEGTPNYWIWLRIYYYDAAQDAYLGTYVHVRTQDGRSVQYTGIYWDGWMYCEADLRPYAQYVTDEHPLILANGRSFMNLTFIPGGSADENGNKIPMGEFAAGSLYFDNFRLVYGDTVDDMENPVVDSVTANGTAVAADGSTTVDSNTLKLAAAFHDPEGENATGIQAEKTAIYVDGMRRTLTASEAGKAAAEVTVPNGTHSITVSVSDGFGNVTKDTRYVTVAAKKSDFGSVSLSGDTTATISEPYTLTLSVQDSAKVSALAADIQITDTFGEPAVTFENGYTGTFTYEKNVLHIEAESDAPKTGAVAKISFQVSPATAQGTVFTYTVQAGSFTDGETKLTFAQPAQTVGVTAPYTLSADIMTAGASGKIYVSLADGSAPGRVEIYAVQENGEDVLVGKTNRSGVLVTNRFCQTAGETFTIYAKGENGVSFRYTNATNGVGNTDVTPTNVRLNAVTDPATTQSVTWFAAPQYTQQKAVLEYVTADAYDSGKYEFRAVTGESQQYAFAADRGTSLINTVELTGLKPGTTYCYRVGDGIAGHWSEVQRFTTSVSGADTSFFVMGDTQLSGSVDADAADIETLHKVGDGIAEHNVNFGVQTGDYIDSAADLEAWDEIQGIFAEDYPATSIVQVLGNHEYYADTSGKNAQAIFNTPDKDYYSVEYGNVYVAVINCNADLTKAAEWLVQDAQASDCQWKVLTLHQPPYYTNPKGSSAAYNEFIPPAAEKAGIDFVFSGHDHAYARTEPIAAGTVDEENGVVYFICGDLGEKSRGTEYAAVNNPDFHFAKINQKYDALYLIVNATDKAMTVTAYNLDGAVIDTYTKNYVTTCDRDGHQCVYDAVTKTIVCTACGEKMTEYTGWVKDLKTGKSMYFLKGAFKTGWFSLGDEVYHFGSDGLQHTVTVVEDIPTSCSKTGHKTVKCACGATTTVTYGKPAGHVNGKKTAEDGTVYYECTKCGHISPIDVPFVDLPDQAWYMDYIGYVYENGLMNGTSPILFEPNANLTRVQLVTILWRIDGEPESDWGASNQFEDVESGWWYTPAVNWAAEHKIVLGVSENRFDLHSPVTREQMATIFYRYAVYKGYDVENDGDLSAFQDAGKVHDYALDAMKWIVDRGIINGMKADMLAPLGSTTRAQAATIMMRFVESYQ